MVRRRRRVGYLDGADTEGSTRASMRLWKCSDQRGGIYTVTGAKKHERTICGAVDSRPRKEETLLLWEGALHVAPEFLHRVGGGGAIHSIPRGKSEKRSTQDQRRTHVVWLPKDEIYRASLFPAKKMSVFLNRRPVHGGVPKTVPQIAFGPPFRQERKKKEKKKKQDRASCSFWYEKIQPVVSSFIIYIWSRCKMCQRVFG